MKYLYLDGSCGISGDMTVAALLDLGASCEKLEAAIAALHLEGVHTHIEKSNSYSIAGLSTFMFTTTVPITCTHMRRRMWSITTSIRMSTTIIMSIGICRR